MPAKSHANPKAIWQAEKDIEGNEGGKTLLSHHALPTSLPHVLVLSFRQVQGGLWGWVAQAGGRWVAQGQNSGGVKEEVSVAQV